MSNQRMFYESDCNLALLEGKTVAIGVEDSMGCVYIYHL